jgi:hypothetical protein
MGKRSSAVIRGVYGILNTLTSRIYVGSSVNVSRRWNAHRWELETGRHINKHLQRAWDKYGIDAFD